jgi:predicted GNAT family N-acyltransferase
MLNRQVILEDSSIWEEVKIIDAYTEQERQAIYRFRYKIQVEEMKRDIPETDHLRKRIFDRLDSMSSIVYAESCGRIVGTARLVIGYADDFPEELNRVFKLTQYQQFACGRKIIGFATKLMVDPYFRKTPLSYRLMARVYEFARDHNVQFSFSGSNPYLIPMYEHLGYRRVGTGFQDPGYGFIIPTLLLVEDIVHLTAVRSPYLRVARKLTNSPEAKVWVQDNIPEAFAYPVELFVSEEERWNWIIGKVGDQIGFGPVIRNTTETEARKIIHIGTPFECRKGQQFIRNGDVCNELNILVSGEMEVVNSAGGRYMAKSGAILGSVGLLGQTNHSIDIVAITDCEVLAVSRFPFEKLLRSMPGLADKIRID